MFSTPFRTWVSPSCEATPLVFPMGASLVGEWLMRSLASCRAARGGGLWKECQVSKSSSLADDVSEGKRVVDSG